ncbi:hypothetical protein CGC21_20490 [Leishmania donovani]|uniref:Uncharacterized protein n=1 Tax=Leishmania donovani TaxID=5661 RepID=A0A504X978_LEIDO|nr:hypothetical protein CGC21_20490 [Leishmania donovani]
MRGNLYSRGFDPMKSRSERRKEKQAKLAKTKRVIRLKKRLGRIAARKFAVQEDSHMTALMESYILRRKAERAAEKAKDAPKDGAEASGEGGLAGKGSGAEESEMDEDEGSDSSSLGSRANSAFDVDDRAMLVVAVAHAVVLLHAEVAHVWQQTRIPLHLAASTGVVAVPVVADRVFAVSAQLSAAAAAAPVAVGARTIARIPVETGAFMSGLARCPLAPSIERGARGGVGLTQVQ